MIYKSLEYQIIPEFFSNPILYKTFVLQPEDRCIFSGVIHNPDGSLASNCAVILQEIDPQTNTSTDISLVFTTTAGRFVFSFLI